MKKNKFYIFITILTVISLFSFAAVCNQCATATEEEKTDIGEFQALLLMNDKQQEKELVEGKKKLKN